MYIPNHFQSENHQSDIGFMKRYSFATLINTHNNYPEATNLPFLVEEKDGQLILSSHFAKANPQAKIIEENLSLVIFNEPHAYISPSNYEKEQNVPTWNYIAIHAYGQAKIVQDVEEQLRVLDKMVQFYDDAYVNQWQSLPMDYKLKMVNGIVAFDIVVTDLQAKYKLSQNRTAKEQENIVHSLSASADTNEKEIAAYMSKLKEDH